MNGINYEDEIARETLTDKISFDEDGFITSSEDTTEFENAGIDITIASDQTAFAGRYLQSSDNSTVVTKLGKIFAGRKDINAGKLLITTEQAGIYYSDVYVGEAEFGNYATIQDGGVLDSTIVTFTSEGGKIGFYKIILIILH